MDRREFLRGTAASGAGLLIATRLPDLLSATAAASGKAPFQYGVASGDPLSDALVIWTRLTPTADATPGSGLGKPVEGAWQVAEDEAFSKITKSGRFTTTASRDHTVSIDAEGLAPDTLYYYRFKALGKISPVGRGKTAAKGSVPTTSLRFGLASCANYEGGYFSAYRYLAERDDLDFILHMGDYIYEYAPGAYGPGPDIGRVHEPDHEIVSLADYRIRHALYKTDPDLQALHAAHPFISAWDDHEVTNDTFKNGAENHQEEEGKFKVRRRRAYKAYFEWMPIRLPKPQKDPTRIYRRFQFGDLADLHMLDTRQYRDVQAENGQDPAVDDPERTITGDAQMAWLKKGLAAPKARWRMVGTQVQIAPIETGEDQPFNVDTWDGYRADRDELLAHIADNEINNVTFLTGDIHTTWACDVPIDSTTYPATPSVAVEMVGPSITSDNLDEITNSPPRTSSIAVENGLKADNPHLKHIELDSHGYSIVDVTPERLQVDWFYISDRTDPKATQAYATSWQAVDGANAVSPAEGPVASDRP